MRIAKIIERVAETGVIPPPDRRLLNGYKAIAEYMGVTVAAVRKWAREEGFPVCMLPDGSFASSTALIDQWILARATIIAERQKHRKPIGDMSQAAPGKRKRRVGRPKKRKPRPPKIFNRPFTFVEFKGGFYGRKKASDEPCGE